MDVAPLLITGMHRSGTSATARLLQHAGLDVGRQLLAPALDNPLGYYEDLEFCDLNLELIAAGVGNHPDNRPDWAFADRMVTTRLAPLRPRAEKLVAARAERGHAWGFKDPRTSVLLDFYEDVIPDARHLFVYRSPWEVLTSLIGSQERSLRGRADLAVRAWVFYNERLLEFRKRHPGRTVLVHLDAVAQRPGDVIGLVQAQAQGLAATQLDANAGRQAFVSRILRRADGSAALAELLAADHPEAMDVYARLEAAADLPAHNPSASRRAMRVDIESLGGALDLAAVLVGAPADGIENTTRVARPTPGASPGVSADAAVARLPDEIVVVLFDGQLRPDALEIAARALRDAPDLGAVLLAPGGPPQPARAHDPLSEAEAGAGVVVRRATWVATRGFAAVPAPTGYEGWAFAVACVAAGTQIARIDGALHLPDAARDNLEVRRQVLEAHPALAAQRALDAERLAAEAARRAELAQWNAAGAEERAAGAGQRAEDARALTQAAEALLDNAEALRRDAEAEAFGAAATAREAQERALAADERADRATAAADATARRARVAAADHDRVARELDVIRSSRAWRLVVRWRRLRGLLQLSRRAG